MEDKFSKNVKTWLVHVRRAVILKTCPVSQATEMLVTCLQVSISQLYCVI